MQACHLAVDIGASSGRHIVGSVKKGKIFLNEVYRFENRLYKKNGHLCWDLNRLFDHILTGILECQKQGFFPSTMGIDTWAVDYVMLDKKGHILGDSIAYRDSRTDGIRERLEQEGFMSFDEHYKRTGIQYQKFNTIYQLAAVQKESPDLIAQAEDFLMIPDYLNYLLTGIKVNEYTNATTTALVNATTKDWDTEIISRLGLPQKIFKKISLPGIVLGNFTPEIQKQTGTNMKVVLPATHDTGSAFLSVPAKDDSAVFLSSGTWSLMGVENPFPITNQESCRFNFTNEGGYDYRFRCLKNIMGLWMIQSVKKELVNRKEIQNYWFQGRDITPSFSEFSQSAKKETSYQAVLDVNDGRFLAPDSMCQEVQNACRDCGLPEPTNIGQLVQCIYQSLAEDYRRTIQLLSRLTGKSYTCLHIIGGGCQDMLLNQMTANATGLPVYAGPVEGTALGNLIVQFIHAKEFSNLQEARDSIRQSFEIKKILPE